MYNKSMADLTKWHEWCDLYMEHPTPPRIPGFERCKLIPISEIGTEEEMDYTHYDIEIRKMRHDNFKAEIYSKNHNAPLDAVVADSLAKASNGVTLIFEQWERESKIKAEAYEKKRKALEELENE